MGLEGEQPQSVDPESIEGRVKKIQTGGEINLLKERAIKFDYQKVNCLLFFSFSFFLCFFLFVRLKYLVFLQHLIFHMSESLPQHPNGMRFTVFNQQGDMLATNEYYSIGGGFVIDNGTQYSEDNAFFRKSTSPTKSVSDDGRKQLVEASVPFKTADDLLTICKEKNMSFSDIVIQNELKWRSKTEIYSGLMVSGALLSCSVPWWV